MRTDIEIMYAVETIKSGVEHLTGIARLGIRNTNKKTEAPRELPEK
jgi:hypothetical protein